MKMKWYVAKYVYQIISGEGNHTPQFDEQLRLIRAEEFNWAKEKALIIGKLGEYTFVNQQQQTVTCKFINVTDMHALTEVEDGVELYSSTYEPKDVTDYLTVVGARANRLLASC
jgi:hypothetical protein